MTPLARLTNVPGLLARDLLPPPPPPFSSPLLSSSLLSSPSLLLAAAGVTGARRGAVLGTVTGLRLHAQGGTQGF